MCVDKNLKPNRKNAISFIQKLARLTLSASSWLMDVNGVPFTSSIVSPGRRPARSASDPSSIRDMYTPTPVKTKRKRKKTKNVRFSPAIQPDEVLSIWKFIAQPTNNESGKPSLSSLNRCENKKKTHTQRGKVCGNDPPSMSCRIRKKFPLPRVAIRREPSLGIRTRRTLPGCALLPVRLANAYSHDT